MTTQSSQDAPTPRTRVATVSESLRIDAMAGAGSPAHQRDCNKAADLIEELQSAIAAEKAKRAEAERELIAWRSVANKQEQRAESAERELAAERDKSKSVLAAACKPWEYCTGEPPEWESPLQSVWQACISWCQELVAKSFKIEHYDSDGATETLEGDTMVGFGNIIQQVIDRELATAKATLNIVRNGTIEDCAKLADTSKGYPTWTSAKIRALKTPLPKGPSK